MAYDPIPQFTQPVPSRDDTSGAFAGNANTLVSELPTFVTKANALGLQVNNDAAQVATNTATVLDAEAVVVAAANFAGAWASLTGALNVPASVSHSGALWLLLTDLADVTASEPSGANSDWRKIDYVSETRTVTAGTGLTGGGNLSADRTINVDVATAANVRAGTANKMLDAASVRAANAAVSSIGSGLWAPDLNAAIKLKRTLTGNSTLGNPTNQVAGQEGAIFIEQDATGGWTLSVGSNWVIFGGVPDMPTAPGATISIGYYVLASGTVYGWVSEAAL